MTAPVHNGDGQGRDLAPGEFEYMMLPHRYPVPDGWVEAPHQRPMHHHAWSRIVLRGAPE